VIALLLVVALLPRQVLIATPRGQASVPVSTERGVAAVAAPRLAQPLGLVASLEGTVVRVVLGGRTFEFDLGAPFVRTGDVAYPLVGAPYVARDTLFLPLHWLADYVPRLSAGRYRWDPVVARLEEIAPFATARAPTPTPVASPPIASIPRPTATAVPAPVTLPLSTANPITGLQLPHTVVVDPGHGGIDPGNPGLHFPGRLAEKDITLAIGRLLRAELVRRGLTVVLTRSTDTLIDLADRPLFCRAECDLFVSIHVNAMPKGQRQGRVSGVETYFLSDAKTEDQKRVTQMENDAMRFEMASPAADGPLAFILRDLQLNEYLRESARLAELVQGRVAAIHPGGDRGVQQGLFFVLAAARRPAVLVETGFATHKADGPFLATALGQRKIVNAIADGVVAYLLEFERKLAVGGSGR
jgi:N-acetylmuramoyl-L-alanine amidase